MSDGNRRLTRPQATRRRRAVRIVAFAGGCAALAAGVCILWRFLPALSGGRYPEIPSESSVFRYLRWLENPFVVSQTIGEAEAGLPPRKRPKRRPPPVPAICLPRSAEAGCPDDPRTFDLFVPLLGADPWFFPAATQLVGRLAPVGMPCPKSPGRPVWRSGSGVWTLLQYQPSWFRGCMDFGGDGPDALLEDSPTREDLEEAKEWLVHPERTRIEEDGSPVLARTILAYNPLVFHVPADSPVTNLTAGQLRLIFVDRVRTWREAGVDAPGPVFAYERDTCDVAQRLAADWLVGTGSWERLNFDAPKRRREWAAIRRDPLHRYHSPGSETMQPFRAHPGAIGFSLLAQAAPFVADGTVRLLAVDGVEPTAENIARGLYPIGRALELICMPFDSRPRGRNLRLVRDYLQSGPGRRLIESAGFLPAPSWAPLPPVRENGDCDACAESLLGY